MLIEFRFKNFKSFKDAQVLSLVASKGNEQSSNLIELNLIKDMKLLPSIVIYGANASGKSSILDALDFCIRFIRQSAKNDPEDRISVQPFLLDAVSHDEPSEFEFTFIQEDVRYQYGFEVTKDTVLKEWLISYPKGRGRNLFQREVNKDTGKSIFSFSSYLMGEKEKLVNMTGSNSLFLSIGATFNNEQLKKVYRWFSAKPLSIKAHEIKPEMFSDSITKERYLNQMRELIKFADFGIVDISIGKQKFDYDNEIPNDVPKNLIPLFKSINNLLKNTSEELKIEPTKLTIEMMHTSEGESIQFPIESESAGTIKFFTLSFPIIHSLQNGRVLFVDELDSSLHPLLVRSLVNLFHDPSTNPRGAQLIFNTHDTTLLNSQIFRRDQIWFVEKDQNGSSHIYSLLDFRPRKDEALEKGYLQGKYGAIPFLSDLPREVAKID